MAKSGTEDGCVKTSDNHQNAAKTASKSNSKIAIENVSCKDNGVISKDILVNGINSVLDEDDELLTCSNGTTCDVGTVTQPNYHVNESIQELVNELVNTVASNADLTLLNHLASKQELLPVLQKQEVLRAINGMS